MGCWHCRWDLTFCATTPAPKLDLLSTLQGTSWQVEQQEADYCCNMDYNPRGRLVTAVMSLVRVNFFPHDSTGFPGRWLAFLCAAGEPAPPLALGLSKRPGAALLNLLTFLFPQRYSKEIIIWPTCSTPLPTNYKLSLVHLCTNTFLPSVLLPMLFHLLGIPFSSVHLANSQFCVETHQWSPPLGGNSLTWSAALHRSEHCDC